MTISTQLVMCILLKVFVYLSLYFFFIFFLIFVKGFVAGLMSIEDKDELEYTKNSIEKNFSNYFAWHNQRCDLLFSIMSASSGILKHHLVGFVVYNKKQKGVGERYRKKGM